MLVRRIHHVAYRCGNAKETVHWYGKYLKMGFIAAIAEDHVPSTGEPDPYMHVFLDAGSGNILAFFELPTKPAMSRDPNTPVWTQHLALEVESVDDLLDVKARLEGDGIEVVGPTDHRLFQSIYFFDPSGHRLELAVNTGTSRMAKLLDEARWEMLNEFDQTKRAPRHARWMHDGSYKEA